MRYHFELENEEIHNVPDARPGVRNECLSEFGFSAIVTRIRRSRAYINANKVADVGIRAIITPSGDRVTAF